MRALGVMALLCLVVGLTACGGSSETTTVIREVRTPATHVGTPQPKPASHPTAAPSQEAPPNVVGLPLPAAKQLLSQAGYKTVAKNTDTTFGIIVPSHYTICTQSKPRGDLVVVLAQKYGC